jgi:DNA-directed RNA polymerase specialized sigma24 family protein
VELTDADLLARVLVDGDQHAFGELVRRHQSPVRGLLRQLVRADVELADDLAQETFIRAYKHIRSFRGEAKSNYRRRPIRKRWIRGCDTIL